MTPGPRETAASSRRRRRTTAGPILAAAGVVWATILASPGAMAQGCAMCGTAVQGFDDPLARAMSYSTLFLLSMPFAVFFSVGGWIFLSWRNGWGTEEEFEESGEVPVGADPAEGGER